MSTIEAAATRADLVDALAQVEAQDASVRRTSALFPNAHVSPAIFERYDAKMTALRWLLGHSDHSPITKAAGSGVPTYDQVAGEADAAEKILHPGHRRDEQPAGFASYVWVSAAQSTFHWALGWFDEPHPSKP